MEGSSNMDADAANPDESLESNQVSIAVPASPDESSELNQVSNAVADAASPDELLESNQVSIAVADATSPVESEGYDQFPLRRYAATTPVESVEDDWVGYAASHAATPEELLEYNQALNANVSNFVLVKLSGQENYDIWHAQMMCLLKVYNMHGILDDIVGELPWYTSKSGEIKDRYFNLLRGWIYGSIDQHVFKHVRGHSSHVRLLIKKLENLYAFDEKKNGYSAIDDTSFNNKILMDISPKGNESTELMMKLLDATMEGSWWKAKAILKNHKDAATMVINNNGDTMLHLAVKEGKNYFVNQLINFIKDERKIQKLNSEDQTALHIAAIVGNEQAAELLVNKSNELLHLPRWGEIPLVSAFESGQINTFLYLLGVTKDGLQLLPNYSYSWERVNKLLANAISTKQYNLALKLLEIPELLASAAKSAGALMALTTDFPPELGFCEALIYPSSDSVRQNVVKRSSLFLYSFENLYIKAHGIFWAIRNLLKRTDLICLEKALYLVFIVLILLAPAVFCLIYLLIRIVIFVLLLPSFMLYPHLWKGLVYAGLPIKHIEKKKRDYGDAKEVLKLICNEMNKKITTRDYRIYHRSILEAARVDACEVVVQILRGVENHMVCWNKRKHDVCQIAILNRSEKIYNRLSPGIKRIDPLRRRQDLSYNRLTHLAAKLASSIVLSRTTGAALQLQQELQWHEEVKKLMLPEELTYKNIDEETSDMVFTREHAALLKEGEQWMKTTAESCSITAALIVTIVFAAAITVPGGSNQETGIPLFKKEIAFTIFAVCDALSLFTAATALLVFLSILTTRFAEKDFLISLPRRLIFGLGALFISTTAMMVAFGAILFLVFCDQRPWMLAPIGLFTCLPISVMVTLQLPLLVDLFQSTYISRFGKQKLH